MPEYPPTTDSAESSPRSGPQLLNAEQAAEYIGASPDFVRRKLRYEVPVVQYKTRGPLRFFKTDLDRWIAEHTQQPVR